MEKTLTETQLYTLLESMRLINSTLDLDQLLSIIMKEITENLNAERGTLYIVDHGKNEIWSKIAQGDKKLVIRQAIGKGLSGHVAKTGKSLNIRDAYSDARFNPEFDKKSGFRTCSVLCIPVFDMNHRIIAILQILNKKNGFFTQEDQVFTSVFADYISLAIQNAQLYQEALERKRLENEIALAGEIQKMLLPSQSPQLADYDVYSFQQPSRHIGGDYYDFFLNEDNLFFILADVAGKGTPAALLMANLQATIRGQSLLNVSAKKCLEISNKLLYHSTDKRTFVSLFYGILDTHKHTLSYSNAGQNIPILFSIESESFLLTTHGLALGLQENVSYRMEKVNINPGEMLIIYTDGISESMNEKMEEFGEERLLKIVEENKEISASKLIYKIIGAANEHSGNTSQSDDMTLVVVKRKFE